MRGQGVQDTGNGGQGPLPDRQPVRRPQDRGRRVRHSAGAGGFQLGGRRSPQAGPLLWHAAGQYLAAASVVFLIVMQAVAGQWFPPPISVSQYGIGPWGWIFSAWAVTVALAPVCLERAIAPALAPHTRVARWLLIAGAAGAFVMALVRTQAGGAQQTLNAKIHTAGSIVALAFLPLGILAVLWWMGGRWRIWAVTLVALITVSLSLLLLAASGVDSAGLGPTRSWAFWQAIAVVLCQVLTTVMAWAARWLAAGARAP